MGRDFAVDRDVIGRVGREDEVGGADDLGEVRGARCRAQPGAQQIGLAPALDDADHQVAAFGVGFVGDLDAALIRAVVDATPGLAEGGNEFYSVAGAERLAEVLPTFAEGRAVVGVCGAPFKCPPAPSEAALLLHDFLTTRGVRERCRISFVIPFGTPIPPSPDTSEALVAAFAERDIEFIPNHRVASLDPERRVVHLDGVGELPYDLFLGVPRHRAPDVVLASGMAEDGYIPVDSRTLETRVENVYAVGDVATVGVPKAGVFAEGAARVVATSLLARIRGDGEPGRYDGLGSCYVEFGAGRVGRVDVDFLSGPEPTGTFREPSTALVAEKRHFGASRAARWFGRSF